MGGGHPCFVIAEAGVNHDGDLKKAQALIDAAAEAGADAVKFQTFDVDTLVSSMAPTAPYQKDRTGSEGQMEMLKRLALPQESYPRLIKRCAERGIAFLSTPFSEPDADLLKNLGVEAIKLGSGELTNLPLLEHVAQLGLPVLLSTGMSTMAEVAAAVKIFRGAPLVVLHCVSAYPAPLEELNLKTIPKLRETLEVDVGFSDHSIEHEAALGAVALGAVVIERHLTLDRASEGPDHAMSSEPSDLTLYIQRIRALESAMGSADKRPAESEAAVARVARRSLFARQDLPAGTELRQEHLIALRPGTCISPFRMKDLVGKTVSVAVKARTMIEEGMLE